jgi:hypothetical protein
MRRRLAVLSATLAIFSLATQAEAGSVTAGMISKIEMGPLYGELVYIQVTNAAEQPACQTGSFNFVFDSGAAGGKQLLAAILAARMAQQTVSLTGMGTCSLSGSTEDLRWFRVENP